MMTKTTDLIGAALDWAVTTIETPEALRFGLEDWREQRRAHTRFGEYLHRWSTSWSWAGPIIEMERISVCTEFATDEWAAWSPAPTLDNAELQRAFGYGPTPLIAAMRCYVASKLGDEIDVPDELEGK
jgi:hypothetical protein